MDLSQPDGMCATCRTMSRQDALTIKSLETISTIHNACAPIVHWAFRCKVCSTRWLALEVYDEDGKLASEWSWEVDRSPEA